MSNPIDELFKRAFPKKEFPYSDSYWDKFQADLPPSSSSAGFGSGAGTGVSTFVISAAASVVGVGIGIVATTLYLNPPSTVETSESLIKPKNEVVENKVKQVETLNEKEDVASFVQVLESDNLAEVDGDKADVTETKVVNASIIPVLKVKNEASDNRLAAQSKLSNSGLPSKSIRVSQVNDSRNVASNSTLISENKTVQSVTFKPNNEMVIADRFSNSIFTEEQEIEDETLAQMPPLLFNNDVHNIDIPPKETETEFGEKISSHPSMTYFGEVMAGYNYIDYDGFKGIRNVNNIHDILLKITSHYEVEAGVNFGAEWKGLQFYSGIHFNSLQQSYSLQYTQTSEKIVEHVSHNTYLESVDSTFVGHEVGIVKKDGKEYLGVVNSIYSLDSVYATESDTTRSVEIESEQKKENASYRLEYAYIPVMVGYKVQFKKFFVQVHTGFTVGILTNFSGNLFDEETGKSVALLDNDELNKTTWRYNLSAGVGYQINPRVSISINPTITHSLNGPFKKSSDHSYNYTGYGVKTAIRYNF